LGQTAWFHSSPEPEEAGRAFDRLRRRQNQMPRHAAAFGVADPGLSRNKPLYTRIT